MVPAFREVQLGLNLYPIRKLHTSSPALVKNPIFEGTRKDLRSALDRSGGFERAEP